MMSSLISKELPMNTENRGGVPHSSDSAEKTIHFSQLSSLQDHSLSQLRDHIKQVMIPMLIKTFQCQIDMLAEEKKRGAFQEASDQLKQLDRDLYTLEQWVANCRLQMQKALNSVRVEGLSSEGKEAVKPLQERLSSEKLFQKETRWWKNLFK